MDALRLTGPEPASATESSQNLPESQAFRTRLITAEAESGLVWSHVLAAEHPFYGHATASGIQRLPDELGHAATSDARLLVTRSGSDHVFCRGYDPARLACLVRARATRLLREEIAAIQRAQLLAAQGFGTGMPTVAMVAGPAIGLGFELALAHDVVVAEAGARFGLPELQCGLFPVGGAASFLIRRIGRAAALPILLSGKVYSAEELHRLGLIDVLAEDGAGESAVRDFAARHAHRSAMQRAVYAARRRVRPIGWNELSVTGELWVRTAMELDRNGLAALDRLADSEPQRD